MTHPTALTTTMATFVVRFWRETSAGELRLRGQIEHVQSGQSAVFLDLDAMLCFLRRFGVGADDLRRPTPDEG